MKTASSALVSHDAPNAAIRMERTERVVRSSISEKPACDGLHAGFRGEVPSMALTSSGCDSYRSRDIGLAGRYANSVPHRVDVVQGGNLLFLQANPKEGAGTFSHPLPQKSTRSDRTASSREQC